jgi:plastocyanin
MLSSTLGVNGSSSGSPGAIKITLTYDPTTYAVSVSPNTVHNGDTICFTTTQGKVRVVFVTPFNDRTAEMLDSQERTLSVSGAYPFLCFFTEPGEGESEARIGGVLDVQPHRP